MDARPRGPAAKREPSPEGLGINSEDDLSAIGAALNAAYSRLCHLERSQRTCGPPVLTTTPYYEPAAPPRCDSPRRVY
jgi:hypothetical protein